MAIHRILWRARLVALLRRPPFCWGYREAWRYAAGLYDLYLEEGFGPAEALECDCQYWEG